MTYTASLDKMAKIVTIGVSLLFAVISIHLMQSILAGEKRIAAVCIILALLLIYLFVYAFRPVNYQLTDSHLIIHRMLNDVKIERSEIHSLQLLDRKKLKWTIRTFGVGGLFGYYGKFANSALGKMTWYATRMDKAILIETNKNKKIIVTPDDPEKLIADYESSVCV